MVLAPNGQGFARGYNGELITSQAELNRVLLERCQLASGQNCALFAEGNLIKYGEADFVANHINRIEVPEVFDGMKIPGVVVYWRAYQRDTYGKGSIPFESLAFSPQGGTSSGFSETSQAEASRRALEFCEAVRDLPCTLYMEGDTVAFDLETFEWSRKRIFYGPREFDLTIVPFIADTYRNGVLKTIMDRVAAGQSHAVFAMNRYGVNYIFESPAPATETQRARAITECNIRVPVPTPGQLNVHRCFIYSVDLEVVLTQQQLRDATVPVEPASP